MPTVKHPFAILAPVPLRHLETGLDVAAKEAFVAFGTMKWELLVKVDEMREGDPIPVLIYPSHEDVPAKDGLVVSWWGWYVGHKSSKNGAHPSGMKYRPQSTAENTEDNQGHWAAFWHVEGLRRLPPEKQLPIGKIQGFKGGWRKSATPRGPEIVTLPESLSHES